MQESNEKNTYIITDAQGEEMARLQLQDRLTTFAQRSLIPEYESDISHMKTVLDVACGPGGWALDLAATYPHLEVVGLDVDEGMVAYANAEAKDQGLGNVTFRVMDITELPFDFADSIFDLVNARLLCGVLLADAWQPFIGECMRMLRPGGVLRLTESELTTTTSKAMEQLGAYLIEAWQKTGRSPLGITPRSIVFGLTPFLRRYLVESGCQDILTQPYVLDYSFGTEAHDLWSQNVEVALQLLLPFIQKAIAPAAMQQIVEDIKRDQQASDFEAFWFFMSISGRKPA